MNGNEWTNYMYDMHQYMKKQEKMIETLEARMDKIEKEVLEKKTNTIEKIEYNFDQLKIERLDGTLHIGLSPNDLANMEDFNVHQNQTPNYPPPMKQTLNSELSSYLHENGPALIRDLSTKYNYTMDEGYQSMLIQDMEKQLPGRISFYEQEATRNNKINTNEQLHRYISEQIKSEIYQSLLNYVQTNEQKGEGK